MCIYVATIILFSFYYVFLISTLCVVQNNEFWHNNSGPKVMDIDIFLSFYSKWRTCICLYFNIYMCLLLKMEIFLKKLHRVTDFIYFRFKAQIFSFDISLIINSIYHLSSNTVHRYLVEYQDWFCSKIFLSTQLTFNPVDWRKQLVFYKMAGPHPHSWKF